jgi:hypothetical protein
MDRRTLLQAGGLAAIGSLAGACHKTLSPVLVPPELPQPLQATRGGQGLQLFFNGLCAFVLPKTDGDTLRVAMLNGYPDVPLHHHYPSLVVPRQGLDVANTTARPSSVSETYAIFGLDDLYVTLKVSGVPTPQIKVQNHKQKTACANSTNWDDFGWVLDMSQFFSGPKRDWSRVGSVSRAQFEAAHGSLERDFDGQEQPSGVDKVEWSVNGQDRVLKQAPRLRILEVGPISMELKGRTGTASSSVVVFNTAGQVVNAAILHLPIVVMQVGAPGTRLDDALAYYQMQDPSPLNPATDPALPVPLWTTYVNCAGPIPIAKSFELRSVECACCPPSGV